MAKVYDALRRAEEERKRRIGEVAPTAAEAPVEWEPVGHTVPARRAPLWRRWFTGRRTRGPDAGEINKRRISLLQPDSFVSEQYRTLRGRIDAIAAEHPIRTVVISSAYPDEGKTTASVNLAIVTAMSLGRRVLLVDCDMRKPKVHQALGLQPKAGLAEVLTGEATLEEAVVKVDGVNLEVLAVRGRPANPSELLGSPRMRALVQQAAAEYDRVILDTPAALSLPDAKAVCELADGLVLVVRADVTPQQDLHAVLEILDRRKVLGLLLNGVEVDQGRYGYAS